MKAIYFGNNRVLASLAFGGKMLLSTNDLSLAPEVAQTGIYEVPLTKFFMNHLKPGNVVFDVGANQGYFTILASFLVGSEGKVVSYEANPDMYDILRDNINVNFLSDQAEALNKAVYSKEEELEFLVTSRFPSNSSIYERTENYLGRYNDVIKPIKVQGEPLDVHAERFGTIDLVKMDIEGAEYEAFLGMSELLKAGKVKVVVFEWARIMLEGGRAEAFQALLADLMDNKGMALYSLDGEGRAFEVQIEEACKEKFIPYLVLAKKGAV